MAALKFVWADGRLALASAVKNLHHTQILMRLTSTMPADFAAGYYSDSSTDITWSGGTHPTDAELRYIIEEELSSYGREASYKFSKSSEDTEPEYNFSFLTDPHDELYPCAFDGMTMKPDTISAMKSYVLDALAEAYPDADQFIYFTVYGSGISYNWDEEGDFDIQMWVDGENYEGELTIDDLVADIRRIIQPINFPTFKELGLDTDDCEGKMLIQFYPKPGAGTEEENLASKPYACYDMETGLWLQKPEPITPEFYAEMFLSVEQKAQDMATQAEGLLSELERNSVNWHFWSEMASKYADSRYAEEAEESKAKAIEDKEGVKALFDNVFGGRSEAYSIDGKGIYDERDIVQKFLEVWGIFQRLKHFARQPLPWEEQEMPDEPKESAWKLAELPVDPWTKWKMHPQIPGGGSEFAGYDPTNLYKFENYTMVLNGNPITVQFYGAVEAGTLNPAKLWGEGTELEYSFKDLKTNGIFRITADELRSMKENGEIAHLPPADSYVKEFSDINTKNPQKSLIHPRVPLPSEKAPDRLPDWLSSRTSKWGEITEKAKRLMDSGQVHLESNQVDHAVATVQGDNGVYKTEIWRDDPSSGAITLWNCSCPWGQHSWGRTRQFKKFEGRPCAHTLALYWQSTKTPVDNPTSDQGTQEQLPGMGETRPQAPAEVPFGTLQNVEMPQTQVAPITPNVEQTFEQYVAPKSPGGPNMPGARPTIPIQPNQIQNQQAPRSDSFLKGPKDIRQLEIPGVFSSWQIIGKFNNGDKVRAKEPLFGYDDRENPYVVPRNMVGEVLYSDDEETIAIFPIQFAGRLEPHLVKVEAETDQFMPVKRK